MANLGDSVDHEPPPLGTQVTSSYSMPHALSFPPLGTILNPSINSTTRAVPFIPKFPNLFGMGASFIAPDMYTPQRDKLLKEMDGSRTERTGYGLLGGTRRMK
ncbi:conserved hypothetical protein [Ricinus communis]|uniref:Uncharacterized protein n=1 Tax=Ricinus communis TaxID=3988 RepID=B9S4X1_RICCO|nr:conserved hypothetical protein [Ricinus communis]